MAAPEAGLLSPGKIFHGHYEVVRCISTGAMGAVYEVVDQKTLRRRALKVMLPSLVSNTEMRERFKLEATITANVVSEHIVETFDADVDPETGAPFLVMELLRGDDLANILGEREKLQPAEVVLILSQAARALDKTHAAGIVHRDLKPENIFVTARDDGTPRVKILDFGIAKVLQASGHGGNKQQTINLGTPPYMSPEQILGEGTIDHRADVYAIAHIAYALLVGEPYWLEDSRNTESLYALLLRIVEGAKEPPSARAARYGVALPPAFDAWFAQGTARNPMYRFTRTSDLVLALAKALSVPLETRSLTTSGADWELDSLLLSRTGVMRLAGGQAPQNAQRAPTPPGPDGPRIVVPPMPPAPSFGAAPQAPHAFGQTPPAMTTVAPQPQKKSSRKTALVVLLVAFVVGLGSAALLLRFTRPAAQATTAAPSGAASTPSAETTQAAAPAEPPANSSATAAAPAPATPDTSLQAPASTGKTPSSTPASATTTKTTSTGTKAGTTKKKAGTYDPLREL